MAGERHSHATRNKVTIEPREVGEDMLDNRNFIEQDNRNLIKQKPKHDIRKHFFSHRVVDQWNGLPNAVKHTKDVNNFKNLYDALPKN